MERMVEGTVADLTHVVTCQLEQCLKFGGKRIFGERVSKFGIDNLIFLESWDSRNVDKTKCSTAGTGRFLSSYLLALVAGLF